ncbi:hypothetical protein K0M31_016066 [Melipona bicolor]|uniref:Uncharacterized protein n=1 Tax=Melipona bicolor TaxID=60889 RepID=A0AA40G6N8_9HYME|nr:hypothetical protein K0M31_016066 [Melipona bicolor]
MDFKNICQKDNVEYHTITINSEKTFTIVLKELIGLSEARICENLKNQGVNSLFRTPNTYQIPNLQNHIRPRNHIGTRSYQDMSKTLKFIGRNTRFENSRLSVSAVRHTVTSHIQKERPQSNANKPRGGVLIAVHKSIPVEDILQQTTTNIEIKTTKLKTFPTLTIKAAYTPSKTKILLGDHPVT